MKEPTISETQLYDEFGDPAAIRVSLDDVFKFIKQCFPNLDVSVHYEDYDEYGCEHYIKISGECADILLKKDYGGMYCPSDSLVCSVQAHVVRDESTHITHEFYFKKGAEPEDVGVGSNYANKVKEYIANTKKYLVGTAELFSRVDIRVYRDGRGVHKVPNVTTPYSYDIVYVSDEDFYTDKELRLDIQSCKKDVDEHFEAARSQERYVYDTPIGHILVESPLYPDHDSREDLYDPVDYTKWIATHIVNDNYPIKAEGESLQEAYNKLFDELSQRQKKLSWYAQMINIDGKRVYGLALDMRKDGKYHSPGEKLYVKLVSKGEFMAQAVEEGLAQAGISITPEIMSDLCAGRANEHVPGYRVHPLSDIAVDYFSDDRIYYDYSVVVTDGVIEKESRLHESNPMGRMEWASHRALDDE